jgi:hypothetical protein
MTPAFVRGCVCGACMQVSAARLRVRVLLAVGEHVGEQVVREESEVGGGRRGEGLRVEPTDLKSGKENTMGVRLCTALALRGAKMGVRDGRGLQGGRLGLRRGPGGERYRGVARRSPPALAPACVGISHREIAPPRPTPRASARVRSAEEESSRWGGGRERGAVGGEDRKVGGVRPAGRDPGRGAVRVVQRGWGVSRQGVLQACDADCRLPCRRALACLWWARVSPVAARVAPAQALGCRGRRASAPLRGRTASPAPEDTKGRGRGERGCEYRRGGWGSHEMGGVCAS